MAKIVLFNSISKQYISLQSKIRKNRRTIDWIKISITILIFLFLIWIYWYFINISSTKWFFLRQEMKNLEDTKFSYSITNLEVMKMEKNIWDKINTNTLYNQKKISIEEKIIYLPVNQQLAKK